MYLPSSAVGSPDIAKGGDGNDGEEVEREPSSVRGREAARGRRSEDNHRNARARYVTRSRRRSRDKSAQNRTGQTVSRSRLHSQIGPARVEKIEKIRPTPRWHCFPRESKRKSRGNGRARGGVSHLRRRVRGRRAHAALRVQGHVRARAPRVRAGVGRALRAPRVRGVRRALGRGVRLSVSLVRGGCGRALA